jgi:hypothetical protein
MSNLLHVDEVLFPSLDVEPEMETKIDQAHSKSGKLNRRKKFPIRFFLILVQVLNIWCPYLGKYSMQF